MYLPYLRGRQYELLALRELAEKDLINNKILPIIEPIKPSATLLKTMGMFIEKEKDLAVIRNPQVGNFKKDISTSKKEGWKKDFSEALENKSIVISHIMNENSNNELIELFNSGVKENELIVINKNKDFISNYVEIFETQNPRYALIPEERAFKRKINVNPVLIEDRFKKEARNADYKAIDSRAFSEDHLYFEEEGFMGYSDYSIVGEEYSESGFAPYAVAIHIVYFDTDNSLRVKHFVSNSNEDINDPAGKFGEALGKLVEWKKATNINTYGLEKFVEHSSNETYPGLGTVKKLAIMHHIELISQYFDGVHNK
ncbi:sce7725 family protein [Pontibacillus salicampi]|uniref:Sce7725 family protein n=1 Tax=Pontibacillus salicampi TaxID=1449801 RepID=A0ABV6LLL7_9BACI